MPFKPPTLKHRLPRNVDRAHSRSSWRRRRKAQLRAHPICPCGMPATEVDHRDGNAWNDDPTNLQSLCKSCHSKKTVRCDGGLGR